PSASTALGKHLSTSNPATTKCAKRSARSAAGTRAGRTSSTATARSSLSPIPRRPRPSRLCPTLTTVRLLQVLLDLLPSSDESSAMRNRCSPGVGVASVTHQNRLLCCSCTRAVSSCQPYVQYGLRADFPFVQGRGVLVCGGET